MSAEYRESETKQEDVTCDAERDGVWIKDEVFLPRNVVVWAFRELAQEADDGA